MTHATDGLLQAYLDGEIDSQAAAELSDHLAGCHACAAELDTLRHVGEAVHQALGLLVAPPAPLLRARAIIAAERRAARHGFAGRLSRLGARGIAKAAMLVLALAGAGAAAIPGSPVRRALETTFARVAELFREPAPPVADAPAPTLDAPAPLLTRGAAVLPADGRVRVVLHAPAQDTDITVRLVDAPRAEIATATAEGGVRFRTGAGRIEVAGLSPGAITIMIPRHVRQATIEIDGRVHVYKQGGVLHLSGPAGPQSGDEVSFRIGT
jgi:anti-sigma factor RsiW